MDEHVALLKVHAYFRGIPDTVIREVLKIAAVSQHDTGTVVHDANVPFTDVAFVLRGRLKVVRVDARGTESLLHTVERGDQVGMMAGAVAMPVPIRVIALEPTLLLTLPYEQALELTFDSRELRRLWLTTFAETFRKRSFGAAAGRAPTVLALIHETAATHGVASRLGQRLCSLGERLCVLSERAAWAAVAGVQWQALQRTGQSLVAAEIRRQAALSPDATRIIFEIPADTDTGATRQLMAVADRVLYLAPAAAAESVARRLATLSPPACGWRDKTAVVWLLGAGEAVGPSVPSLPQVASRDFKVTEVPLGPPWGRSVEAGLERLVHDLRGVRIGLSLGGGAARGMAHLGVLGALEEAGIVVDVIAGTSAGAMTGIIYASGLACAYVAERFSHDLRPSWLFRHLPHGKHWSLLYHYRRGHFAPMLRAYLRSWRLEQLPVPCASVALDLVSGTSVVRDRGDAVTAVLESINLPVVSVPLCHNGQAL
ncbi:MAG TPA: patatin-like phospholipase family protein, partial [Myxococcota bacterium]|nr:patatin-like phospholipase family protein [Myxococcota bacterium]